METISTNPFLDVTRAWVKEHVGAESKIPDISLAKLFYQAMEELDKVRGAKPTHRFQVKPSLEKTTKILGREVLFKTGRRLSQIDEARSFLQDKYDELFPEGMAKAVEVLELQQKLGRWISSAQRKEICVKIAEIFESCSTYEAMCDLRETIEKAPSGISPLFKLVYQDVDENTSHKILRAINQKFKTAYLEDPKKIQFHYRIYSDIDDTIKPALNDLKVKISGLYPSAMEFYRQLSHSVPDKNSSKERPKNVRITFLSGRLDLAAKMWDKRLNKKTPKDLKFFTLFGSTKAYFPAMKFYTAKFFMKILDRFPAGPLRQYLKRFVQSLEIDTYLALAIEKRHNIDRDLLLRPEALPIMIGDSGEADLLFTLIKNSGVPTPFEDKRIPEEYRPYIAWKDMDEKSRIGNLSNKPLFLGLTHSITSRTQYSGASPDPKFRKEYAEELNAVIFDNYVDNAILCLQRKLIDKDAASQIVAESRKWVVEQQNQIRAMMKKYGSPIDAKTDLFDIDPAVLTSLLAQEKVSPALKYRLKVILSIKRYDEFISSSVG